MKKTEERQLEMGKGERIDYFNLRLASGKTIKTRIIRWVEIQGAGGFVVHIEGNEWRVSHAATGCLLASGKTTIEAVRKSNDVARVAVSKHGSVERWVEITTDMVRGLTR